MFLYRQGNRPRHIGLKQNMAYCRSLFKASGCFVVMAAMQAFMRPKVEEKTYVVISNPFKDDWHPEWKRVGGNIYIKLDQYNRDFFRHCTGTSAKWGRGWSDSQNHYFPFWHDLIKLRNDVSQAAFEKVFEEMRDEKDDNAKRQKPRKAKMSDAGLAGEEVQGTMRFGGHVQDVKLLFGSRGSELWVQPDEDVLAFIQHAMHSNFVSEHSRPEPKKPRGKNDEADGRPQPKKPGAKKYKTDEAAVKSIKDDPGSGDNDDADNNNSQTGLPAGSSDDHVRKACS